MMVVESWVAFRSPFVERFDCKALNLDYSSLNYCKIDI